LVDLRKKWVSTDSEVRMGRRDRRKIDRSEVECGRDENVRIKKACPKPKFRAGLNFNFAEAKVSFSGGSRWQSPRGGCFGCWPKDRQQEPEAWGQRRLRRREPHQRHIRSRQLRSNQHQHRHNRKPVRSKPIGSKISCSSSSCS
jgi:hypothetical protein